MPDWSSNGLLTNPVANAIVAELVASGDNARKWKVVVSSSVAATVVVEHRDVANTANVPGHTQGFFVPANGSVNICSDIAIPIFDLQRIRIRLNAGITGSIWGSVLME